MWKEEEEKLKEQLRTQEGASSEDQVRIQEFDVSQLIGLVECAGGLSILFFLITLTK